MAKKKKAFASRAWVREQVVLVGQLARLSMSGRGLKRLFWRRMRECNCMPKVNICIGFGFKKRQILQTHKVQTKPQKGNIYVNKVSSKFEEFLMDIKTRYFWNLCLEMPRESNLSWWQYDGISLLSTSCTQRLAKQWPAHITYTHCCKAKQCLGGDKRLGATHMPVGVAAAAIALVVSF